MFVSLDRATTARLVPCATVPGRALFIYGCYTEPRFRGQNIYAAALTHLLRDYRERGYEMAFMRVHRGNRPSITGIEKAGFTRCGNVWHVTVFGFPLPPFGLRSLGRRARRPRAPAGNEGGAA